MKSSENRMRYATKNIITRIKQTHFIYICYSRCTSTILSVMQIALVYTAPCHRVVSSRRRPFNCSPRPCPDREIERAGAFRFYRLRLASIRNLCYQRKQLLHALLIVRHCNCPKSGCSPYLFDRPTLHISRLSPSQIHTSPSDNCPKLVYLCHLRRLRHRFAITRVTAAGSEPVPNPSR